MHQLSRREWLLASACWTELLSAQTPSFRYLNQAGAADIEAIAETILPADGKPGAKEAGVIWFIDRVLAGHDKALQPLYSDGLRHTRQRRKALFPASASIAALSTEQRTALLRDIESTDFFRAVRRHTVLGFFGHPRHGGNRNGASAKVLGYEPAMMYQPPFGYYDREAAAQ